MSRLHQKKNQPPLAVLNADTIGKVLRGASCIREFVSPEREAELAREVCAAPWRTDDGRMQRRVQHYGYVYDYRKRRIDASMRIGPPPEWLMIEARRLRDAGFDAVPDQCIINEYELVSSAVV